MGKTLNGENKLLSFENKPNKNRNALHRSEILAVQTSHAAHPYYSISLRRRQEKLYESSEHRDHPKHHFQHVAWETTLDAGDKPSTLFPPGGLAKLTATPARLNRCKKKHLCKTCRRPLLPEESPSRQHFQPKPEVQKIISRPTEPFRNAPGVSR